MMLRAQVIRIGDTMGIVLPQAVIDEFGIGIDDTLVIVPTPIGYEFWPEEVEAPA